MVTGLQEILEVETTVSERARREKWRAWARAVAVSCAVGPWCCTLRGAEAAAPA